ncbi:MAG: hypothetical protein WC783_04595 [Candidatus Paceibacterota bacterium]|jgi:hypothetical protein
MLKNFTYKFDAGPLNSVQELLGNWEEGNCRRAVQYFTYSQKGIFLKPEQVLCPDAYYHTGEFVMREGESFKPDTLRLGDIMYAEKILNKDEKFVDKSSGTFPTKDDYIISLHTALFAGEKDKEIWHATAIEGRSCFWPLEKFLKFYKVIAVKRV